MPEINHGHDVYGLPWSVGHDADGLAVKLGPTEVTLEGPERDAFAAAVVTAAVARTIPAVPGGE